MRIEFRYTIYNSVGENHHVALSEEVKENELPEQVFERLRSGISFHERNTRTGKRQTTTGG